MFSNVDKRVASIMVEVSTPLGMLMALRISWCGLEFHHRIDFLKVPFHCFSCWGTKHMKWDCPRLSKRSEVGGSSASEVGFDPTIRR